MNSAKPGIKEKDELYRLIISQLFYDGHQTLAVSLSNLVKAHPACPPSDKLLHITNSALKLEEARNGKRKRRISASQTGTGIDLDFETESITHSPEGGVYETLYVTAHKNHCKSAAFSHDGALIATGSTDASIKILDVERMLQKAATPSDALGIEGQSQSGADTSHPVVRTLYDHLEEVTCLDFHPQKQFLVSGSIDQCVKFFDFSKPSVKRASKTIRDVHPIRCLSVHPSGDFVLVGTQHPVLRLYDANTLQCFVSSDPVDQHEGPITAVNYSSKGNMYASSSKDGSLKLWDGVSNRCINTFTKAHDGNEVCSVVFSKNGKYILSSGKDSLVKLWELNTSRCLIAYTGAGTTGKQEHRAQAVFNHTEDYVLFPDEKTISLCCWNSRNAERKKLLALGHNDIVRCIKHSPVSPAFITCSDDYRARFWYKKDVGLLD